MQLRPEVAEERRAVSARRFSLVVLTLYHDQHPHPWVNAAFPAGHAMRKRGGPGCGARFGLAGLDELIGVALGLRRKGTVGQNLRALRSGRGILG